MALFERLWLDSDVLLDWLCDRDAWADYADQVIESALEGRCEFWLSALTLSNAFYIHRKQAGTVTALEALLTLCDVIHIAPMEEIHVRQALASGRSDFEDELQIACAGGVEGLTAFITRNLVDYANGPVSAMTAEEWLRRRAGGR